MSSLITKISGKLIKDYCITSKFCNFSNSGCSIEGKFGSVSFDFSAFKNAKTCHLGFRKESGNGLVSITSNSETKNYTILSRFSETIVIDLEKTKTINIVRPFSGIGHIDLVSISLLSDINIPNESKSLALEISKCQMSGIRTVSGRYFASDKSKLSSNYTIEMETIPPNTYTQNGNFINFTGLCEIVSVKVLDHKLTQLVSNENIHRASNVLIPEVQRIPFKLNFSSSNIRSFEATVDERGAVMNSNAKIGFNTTGLNPNSYYSINIDVINISGNGKFTITVSNSNLNNAVYHVRSKESVKIPFGTANSGPFNVEISTEDSDGIILINEFTIFKSDNIKPNKSKNNYLYLNLSKSKDVFLESHSDTYRRDILNFSRVNAEFYKEKIESDIVINLKPATYSMNSWVAKFCNMFDGVTVDSNLISNIKKQDSDPNVSVLCTDINNLFHFKKIFLEEFYDELKPYQINILMSASTVYCTSLMNCQYLRKIGVERVLYVPKYWPYKKPSNRIINENYDLFFSRSQMASELIVENYPKNRNIVLVGYRGKDLGVKSFDEFIPYSDLLSLIYYADNIIDLPKNMHYYSGLLDFCLIAKKNIITSNHWLSVSKPKAKIVNTKIQNGVLYPDIHQVVSSLNNKFIEPNIDMQSYNYNIKGTLMLLQEG